MVCEHGPLLECQNRIIVHLQDVISTAKDCLQGNVLYKERNQFRAHLATHFGNFSKESFDSMTGDTQAYIGIVLEALEKMSAEYPDINDAEDAIINTGYPDTEHYAQIGASELITDDNNFKLSGNPSEKDLNEFTGFIKGVIMDPSIYNELGLQDMAKDIFIIANTHMEILLSQIKDGSEEKEEERPVFKVGVLHFPEMFKEYFMVYELNICVMYEAGYKDIQTDDAVDLRIIYHCRKYPVDQQRIDLLDQEDLLKAQQKARDFYEVDDKH